MQKKNRWILGATATVLGGVLVLGGSLPAVADPTGAPVYRLLNGTGSDTTQDLNNGLAAVVRHGGQLVMASYDATLPDGADNWIQTRFGGTYIPRPNGSGQ
ncbi:hypothetical protein, partial [Microbacterium album]|uniref:hypothetical protein n=1 Tax=Microbacterium album TaxID=2053191 RepID=UPI001E4EE51B